MFKSLVVTAAIAAAGLGVGYYAGTGGLPAATAQAAVSAPATAAPLPTPAATIPVLVCTPQSASDAPATPAQAPVAEPVSQAGLVNLNTATDAELDKLPSIGKARITHIVAARPIKAIDDLAGPGMPADVIAMLHQRATV